MSPDVVIYVLVDYRFNRHKARLETMHELLRVLMLMHTTSAVSERSFSLVSNYITDQQSALKDETLLAQIATQFNDRQARNAATAGGNAHERPNEYRSVWTGVRDLLARQQAYATWYNRPPQRNQGATAGPLVQMLAAAGSQVHQAQLQAQGAHAGNP
jgi:hypothetical protein